MEHTAGPSDSNEAHARAECVRGGLNRAVLAHHLTEVLGSREIDRVLDVGAHDGGYGRVLRGIGYSGPIVSFEPVEETYAALEAVAAEQPPWETRRLALSDEDGEAEITVFAHTDLSSMMEPSAYAREEFGAFLQEKRRERVPQRRLDGIFREVVPDGSRVMLKIDAQGTESRILAGSKGCLADISAVQVEVAVKPFYDGARPWWEVQQALGEHGFELSGAFVVTRDRRLRVIELDCIFVRG